METYDMKPDAPAEYRGDFRPDQAPTCPASTSASSCRCTPRSPTSSRIIRSIAHNFADHGGGHKRFLTGRDPPLAGRLRQRSSRWSARWSPRSAASGSVGVPNYICRRRRRPRQASTSSASAPPTSARRRTRSSSPATRARPNFEVQNLGSMPSCETAACTTASHLLQPARPTPPRHRPHRHAWTRWTQFSQRALNLLTTDAARRAFDLSQEPLRAARALRHAPLRPARAAGAAAGRGGRQLRDDGHGEPASPGAAHSRRTCTYNWDSHAVNCHIFNDARCRFPIYDRAVTALIEDLYARGLDRKVLLIVTGEFGRTPRHHATPTAAARPRPLAAGDVGARLRRRHAHGPGRRLDQLQRRTSQGPPADPQRPLGHDVPPPGHRPRQHRFLDHSGRPMPILPFGEPIAELS